MRKARIMRRRAGHCPEGHALEDRCKQRTWGPLRLHLMLVPNESSSERPEAQLALRFATV